MTYRGRVLRPLTPLQWMVDAFVGVGFLGFAGLVSGSSGLSLLAGLVLVGAVVLRRFSPGLALAIAWVAALVAMLSHEQPSPANVGILVVLYATAAYGSRAVLFAGLGSVLVGAIVATVYLTVLLPNSDPLGAVFLTSESVRYVVILFAGLTLLLGVSWLLGLLHRTLARARSSARAREEAERTAAVEQERNRIARDMHDVVAHSLAVVIAQADGARYLTSAEKPEVGAALETIAGTARSALGEVRGLLAQLRHRQEAGPQPDLARLPALLADFRAAGLAVEPVGAPEDGAVAGPALGEQASIAAYRIVQEALTNALRHGAGAPVRLDLRPEGDRLVLVVANVAADPGSRVGHGLVGMAERAALAGGEVTAGWRAGEFRVEGWLPIERGSAGERVEAEEAGA